MEGLSSREILKQLVISPNTLRTHLQRIFQKMHVHSRLEAAAAAVRMNV
ncbi:MAG: response regulator transcription factor [Actinomycetota bacterium]